MYANMYLPISPSKGRDDFTLPLSVSRNDQQPLRMTALGMDFRDNPLPQSH
jgi:hypothetical protein